MRRFPAAAVVLLTALSAAGQQAKPGAITKADPAWKAPLTEDGQPDLTGIWTNNFATPLERPRQIADREFFTEAEVAILEKGIRERPDQNEGVVADTAVWWEKPKTMVPTNRTSLIIDPPDGRIPPLTAAAQAKLMGIRVARREHPDSGPEDFDLQSRCIVSPSGGPIPMLPSPYNNDYQIYQTKDYVVIEIEMIHDTRIIPLDGTSFHTRTPAGVRQWLGESHGHWEGNTLVVETRNFTYQTRFRGADENLRLVERFTRTAPDMLTYRFTVDDPTAFTRPWTAEVPMVATPGPLYEFACHEGNDALPNMMKTARLAEEKAEENAAHEAAAKEAGEK